MKKTNAPLNQFLSFAQPSGHLIKGFTLIELLVVIAIIGLLASVVLVSLNSARQKSRDAKRLADVKQLASALELYYNDNYTYPTGASGVNGAAIQKLQTKYVSVVPTAPNPADGTCTAQQNGYSYDPGSSTGNNSTSGYSLTFCLGADTGGYSKGVRTLTQAGIQ